MRAELLKQLTRDEGFSSKPYKDTRGVLTIGYGRNLTDVGISESEAYSMLDNDVARAMRLVTTTWPWTVDLDDARLGVMVNMCFNMGLSALRSFTTFLGLMEAGSYFAAASDLDGTAWAKEVPTRAARLKEQLTTGQWQ